MICSHPKWSGSPDRERPASARYRRTSDEDTLHSWPDAETTSTRLIDPPAKVAWFLTSLLRKMVLQRGDGLVTGDTGESCWPRPLQQEPYMPQASSNDCIANMCTETGVRVPTFLCSGMQVPQNNVGPESVSHKAYKHEPQRREGHAASRWVISSVPTLWRGDPWFRVKRLTMVGSTRPRTKSKLHEWQYV